MGPHMSKSEESSAASADQRTLPQVLSINPKQSLLTEDNAVQTGPRKRRNRRSAYSDDVILSSRYVAGRIRSRYDVADAETDPYWCEFPRVNADALEKRGVEIISNPKEKFIRRKIPTADLLFDPSFPSVGGASYKRDTRGKILKRRSETLDSDTRQRYYLTEKDLQWLNIYNRVKGELNSSLSTDDFEQMLDALEVKKNSVTLRRIKSLTAVILKTEEGTSRRFEKEYMAMQKFIELTPEAFAVVNHENLGKSLGLSSTAAFDVWEYWKCKLQDNFFQPLVPPSAPEFDYRRISLLAAWNMTTISFSQRIRHDGERIRLMFDLLQKRNLISAAIDAKEEEVSLELAELLISSEAKSLAPEYISDLAQYVHDLSPLTRNSETSESASSFLTTIEQWIEDSLKKEAEPEPPSLRVPLRKLRTTEKKVLEERQCATEAQFVQKLADAGTLTKPRGKREIVKPRTTPIILRMTRARLNSTSGKNITISKPHVSFEHADNSCCENGPVDEEELMEKPVKTGRILRNSIIKDNLLESRKSPSRSGRMLRNSLLKIRSGDDTEDRPYRKSATDEHGVVLQEFNLPKKPSDFRSRLRSRKPIA